MLTRRNILNVILQINLHADRKKNGTHVKSNE